MAVSGAGATIGTCSCNHEYQDKKYGHKKRVHNKTAKDNECRCTVCGTVRTIGSGDKNKK